MISPGSQDGQSWERGLASRQAEGERVASFSRCRCWWTQPGVVLQVLLEHRQVLGSLLLTGKSSAHRLVLLTRHASPCPCGVRARPAVGTQPPAPRASHDSSWRAFLGPSLGVLTIRDRCAGQGDGRDLSRHFPASSATAYGTKMTSWTVATRRSRTTSPPSATGGGTPPTPSSPSTWLPR